MRYQIDRSSSSRKRTLPLTIIRSIIAFLKKSRSSRDPISRATIAVTMNISCLKVSLFPTVNLFESDLKESVKNLGEHYDLES